MQSLKGGVWDTELKLRGRGVNCFSPIEVFILFVFWGHSTCGSSFLHGTSGRNVCIHESDGKVLTVVNGIGFGAASLLHGASSGVFAYLYLIGLVTVVMALVP